MESSGVIHGPPLPHHPASLFMLTFKPSRCASAHICLNNPSQAGVPKTAGPLGVPWSTSIIATPPMPTRFIASRSAVIPLLVTLPLSQNQNTQGRAVSGGRKNSCSKFEFPGAPKAIGPSPTSNKEISIRRLNPRGRHSSIKVAFPAPENRQLTRCSGPTLRPIPLKTDDQRPELKKIIEGTLP